MNKLQDIPLPGDVDSPGRVLVTMNPTREPQLLQSSQVYYHPLPSAKSLRMAGRLHELHGSDGGIGGGVSFAGAWMGFGFHEDGFAAGTHAADVLIKGPQQAGRLNLVAAVSQSTTMAEKGPMEAMQRVFVLLVQGVITLLGC